MTPTQIILTLIECTVVGLLIYGLCRELGLVAWEQRAVDKIKQKRRRKRQ